MGPNTCMGDLRIVRTSCNCLKWDRPVRLADIYVKCETCDTSRPMSDAFKLNDSDPADVPRASSALA